MLRTRKTNELSDYRDLLAGAGERSVGAYAARQRRRNLLIGGVGVGLIFLAATLAMFLMPSGGDEQREGAYRAWITCENCSYRAVADIAPGTTFPMVCPKCGQRAALRLWVCRACRTEFGVTSGKQAVRCPRCNSRNVGSLPTVPPTATGGG